MSTRPLQVAPPFVRLRGSLAVNTGWSALATLSLILGKFASTVITARILGVSGTGTLAYHVWMAETLVAITGLGFPATATRFVAALQGEGKHAEAAGLIVWLQRRQFVIAAVSTAIIAISGGLSSTGRRFLWIYVAGYYLLQTMGTFHSGRLTGQSKFHLLARLNTIGAVLFLTAVLLGATCFGVPGALGGYIAGALPVALCSAPRKDRDCKAHLDPALRRRCLKYSMFAWISALISVLVWSRAEVFFLERYWDAHTVAMFSVGLTLSAVAIQGPMLLCGAFSSHFANLAGARDRKAMQETYSAGTRLLAAVLFPVCLGLASITPLLLPLLYGENFRESVPFAMLLIGMSVLSFANVGSSLVYGMEKAWFIACGGGIGATLSVLLCLLTIPRYGVWGAVCSRMVVQILMVASGLWFISKRLKFSVPFFAIGKSFAAASVAALGSYVAISAKPGPAGLLLAIPSAALLYIAGVRLLKVMEPEDIRRLRSALNRFRSFGAGAAVTR